jgi:folate-binding protein YgfZ
MPVHYGNVEREYRAAYATSAFFDVSHRGKIRVAGKDAASFLHNLCTNDVLHLPAGAGREAFFTTGQAKIVGHGLVFHVRNGDEEQTFWIDAGPGQGARLLQHLDHYLIAEMVKLEDRSPDFAQLYIAGPGAKAVLAQALSDPLPEMAEFDHLTPRLLSNGGQLRRVTHLALPGFDVLCPRARLPALWRQLVAAGAAPAGLMALDTLRIEAGTAVYGLDIDESNLPHEVGRIETAVSFTKGCYIGQETIARIRTYGHVNRSLVGLRLAERETPDRGAPIHKDGKEIGHITSSVLSPRLGTGLALGYVRRGSEQCGTLLEVQVSGRTQKAEVIAMPLAGCGEGAGK